MDASKLQRLFVPALFLCLLAGCGWTDRVRGLLHTPAEGTTAVMVGTRQFSTSDLQRFFDSRLSDFRDPRNSDKVKSKLLESFVEEKLLLHEAERLNIAVHPQVVQSMLERISSGKAETRHEGSGNRDAELERSVTETLKMQQYLQEHILKNTTVTEQECEAFYNDHLADFVRNDVVHLREILLETLADAERMRAQLRAKRNKNFAELARVYSKAATAADGGDLGTFQRGELPEDFEKAVFRLQPGAVSQIVKTRYGYHIFLVEEKILAHQQKFYEVKDQIQEKLLTDRQREIIDGEIESLMARIPVEIHRDKLDFLYLGTRFPSQGGKKS